MHQHINSTEIKACFPDVGCLVIGQLENHIQAICFKNDFDVTMKRGKGFLSMPLFVTIKCPDVRKRWLECQLENIGAWTYEGEE